MIRSRTCNFCKKDFFYIRKDRKYCSQSCAASDHVSLNIKKSSRCVPRGPTHYRWNPDREEQKLKEKCIALQRMHLRRVIGKIGSYDVDVILGYSWKDLKEHLELHFKPGMSWENHGMGKDKWVIDHIRPISSFPVGTDPQIVNALSNLRPLWDSENRAKYTRWKEVA